MDIKTDEEKALLNRCGNQHPFRTPEGYFESLPEQIMKRIAHRHRRQRFIRWSVAAATIGFLFAGSLALTTQSDGGPIAQDTENIYIEDVLDYSMIDNIEIASYLTEAE